MAEKKAGVIFSGSLEVAYRACLWSRVANRILLPLTEFTASNPDQLYKGIQQINWSEHLTVTGSLAVDFTTSQSTITHSHFAAQKVKDAVVDQFRQQFNERPSVQLEKPSIRINVYLNRDIAIVSLDLSGESLHRRGYRSAGGEAPLKENLAAAILLRASWPEIAKQGGALVDVMCGSGTLPIEAALIASDTAPGLLRDYFGFVQWQKHQPAIWHKLLKEAKQRQEMGLQKMPPIIGFDADPIAVHKAHINIENAGLHGLIHIEKRDLSQLVVTADMKKHPGLVIANPPYGERLGEQQQLIYLYKSLGEKFKSLFHQWHACIFTGNSDLGKKLGLRAVSLFTLYNGTIPCKLLNFIVSEQYYLYTKQKSLSEHSATPKLAISAGAEMFANRLDKNNKLISKWAAQEDIQCYRIYDADLPDYAVAIDRYEDYLHIQEYAPPKSIDPQKAQQRLQEAVQICADHLHIKPENIFLKVKKRQKGLKQYEKISNTQQAITVQEGVAKFIVNLRDYLDTGLFLDGRIIRQKIYQQAKHKHFLNLFAYTGTASVCAALGGATSTTTVDMSAVYLNWAKRNFALNGISEHKHYFVQADCLQWLQEQQKRYDLIYLNPPTFSHSKRMEETLDIQRDHVDLIKKTLKLLTPTGLLIFATNKHQFKLQSDELVRWKIEDISKTTLPKDFVRSVADHYCYLIFASPLRCEGALSR